MPEAANADKLKEVYLTLLKKVSEYFCNETKQNDTQSSMKMAMGPSDISKLFKTVSTLPYSADIQSLRGWCFEQIVKNDLALYVYDEVLDRCPLHGPTLRRKGQLLAKMERYQQSQQIYELATLLEPDNLHLQILKNEEEDDQVQDLKNDDDDDQDKESTSNWVIRIKSIDRPMQSQKSKSVIFKSQLCSQDQISKKSEPFVISRRSSILKTRSEQSTPLKLVVYDENAQIKSSFDISKIRSIDRKTSSLVENPSKQVLFSYAENGLKHTQSSVNFKRRPSIMISKFSICQDQTISNQSTG